MSGGGEGIASWMTVGVVFCSVGRVVLLVLGRTRKVDRVLQGECRCKRERRRLWVTAIVIMKARDRVERSVVHLAGLANA